MNMMSASSIFFGYFKLMHLINGLTGKSTQQSMRRSASKVPALYITHYVILKGLGRINHRVSFCLRITHVLTYFRHDLGVCYDEQSIVSEGFTK